MNIFKPIIPIVFAFLFVSSANSLETRLRLATQPEGNKLTALGEPYIYCALNHLKQPYTLDRIPWQRAQNSTQIGLHDGFFMASKTVERDHYATLSQEILSIKWLFVTLREKAISPIQSNFYKLKFSAELGSARHQWLREIQTNGIIKQEIEAPSDPASVIKMLLVDRVDIALMNSITLKELIKSLAINKQDLSTYVAYEKPTGVYFRHAFIKQNPLFLHQFNQALTLCK